MRHVWVRGEGEYVVRRPRSIDLEPLATLLVPTPHLRVEHTIVWGGWMFRSRLPRSRAGQIRVSFFNSTTYVRLIGRLAGSSAITKKAADSTPSAFDSYDDDLVWIIDRLVERVGGSFGVITRYLALEKEGSIIGRGTGLPFQSEDFFTRVTAAMHCAVDFEVPVASDSTRLSQCELRLVDASGSTYRILCLSFNPSPTVNLVAAVFRAGSDVPFTDVQCTVAAKFYPVLTRYVRLWWIHREERSRAQSYKAALDITDVGVILLDRRLELLFENSRACSLLNAGGGLRREGVQIAAEAIEDDMKLQAALQQSRNFNIAQKHDAGKRQGAPLLSLRREDARRPLIVTVLGIGRAAMDSRDAAVILFVLDPSRDFLDLLAPLCSIYKLTKTEARLAYLLTCGIPLVAAAEKMNVQEATARSYLKQIFLKTFTNRQADLVRLMLSSLQHVNAGVDLEPL